jgi:hypothetical protein
MMKRFKNGLHRRESERARRERERRRRRGEIESSVSFGKCERERGVGALDSVNVIEESVLWKVCT